MRRKLKKIVTSVMTLALLSGSVLTMTSNVSANTTDRKINFDAPVWSWDNPTKPYGKDTSSSVYLYIKTGDNSVKVRTYGCTRNSGSSFNWNKNLTLNKKGEDADSVTCAIGKEYQIYNKIKETGYGYAGLKMQTKGYSSNTVKGVWSPDFTKVKGHKYIIAN